MSQIYVIKVNHRVGPTNGYWHSWIYTKRVVFHHLTIITVSYYYCYHDKNTLGNHKCTASHYIKERRRSTSNTGALAMELRLSCTNPSIYILHKRWIWKLDVCDLALNISDLCYIDLHFNLVTAAWAVTYETFGQAKRFPFCMALITDFRTTLNVYRQMAFTVVRIRYKTGSINIQIMISHSSNSIPGFGKKKIITCTSNRTWWTERTL